MKLLRQGLRPAVSASRIETSWLDSRLIYRVPVVRDTELPQSPRTVVPIVSERSGPVMQSGLNYLFLKKMWSLAARTDRAARVMPLPMTASDSR
jgi:hypothetical protein